MLAWLGYVLTWSYTREDCARGECSPLAEAARKHRSLEGDLVRGVALRNIYERHRRECEDAAATYRDVVHGDLAFGEVDWPAVRKKVKDAGGMLSFLRLSPAQQQRIAAS